MALSLTHLNADQQAAVKHESGPAIVLAGAGSGKTTVLTHHAAWLLETQQLAPESIMLVTFTNKAAGEMKSRIETLTGSRMPFAGTFHSICARLLRIDGHHVGLSQDFVIYDSEDQTALLRDIYKEHTLDAKRYKPAAVKAAISNAKNEMLTPTEYAETASGDFANHIARVYKLYQHGLDKSGAVDFDDLLVLAVRLLEKNPELRERYQQRFSHILVDEYQDTNKAQYQLTKILAEKSTNLYVVGDFSQSIYAWRGADYRNMLQLRLDFPDITEYRLEQNYRSTQSILDAATQVIKHNTSHPILELWTDQTSSQPIVCLETTSADLEAIKIISRIIEHSNQVALSEIAVLYRTNAQSRLFEEALIRAGIPYKLVGGTRFYERKEIKDLIAYSRVLFNPDDSVSFNRAQKIGKRRLSALQAWQFEQDSQTMRATEPKELLTQILHLTGYSDRYNEELDEDRQRLENIAEFLAMAEQFNSMSDLLENVALMQDEYITDGRNLGTTKEASQDAVQLMSLHAAKGLEFSVVFMAGMEDGLLPHSNSLFDPESIEEERRLCYVGITRAKQHLYFSYAQQRFTYGSRTSNIPSRFLGDIPRELLQFEGGSSLPQDDFTEQRVVVDDDLLDDVLNGDIDIDALIER
ncbi:MAG: UvrD-helicase domain-containing protein [Patescibacteria group bacterium]